MNKEEIESILRENDISTANWGTSGHKTVDDLTNEINSGDSELRYGEDDKRNAVLIRIVRLFIVDVFYGSQNKKLRLHEDKQIFLDTRRRHRQLKYSLAGKKKRGEKIPDCVLRLIKEKINIDLDGNSSGLDFHTKPNQDDLMEESKSYPGLPTLYLKYHTEIFLPDKYYDPKGYIGEQKDRLNYYVWKEA